MGRCRGEEREIGEDRVVPDFKMISLAIDLCQAIQKAVKPHLGKFSSRRITGQAVGGDTTFKIDDIAEDIVAEYLAAEGDIAYYSEDKGLISWGRPRAIFIIDPVDGTRPAAAGLESCCVSIAVAKVKEEPLMKDVYFGAVQEIKNDYLFTAIKGEGSKITLNNRQIKPTVAINKNLDMLFWTLGFRGRPAVELTTVLSSLIDKSSTDGGVFDIGSASFSITRLITGQMDACIDIGKRMIDELPQLAERFREVSHGSILNNNPYDIAAAVLIATESGCIATDGYGRTLDSYRLLGSDLETQLSCIVSTSLPLQRLLVAEINAGIAKLKKSRPFI